MTEPASGAATTRFAEVSGLTPAGTGRFDADIHPAWTIAGKPNGGYLLAMLGRAAQQLGSHPHVIAASAHYIRSPDPGHVTIDVETLRTGRNISQFRARMSQQDKSCVEALITTTTISETDQPYWNGGVPPAATAAYEDCIRLVPMTPDGTPVPIMEQVQVRIDPTSAGFTRGEPAGRGELHGWLSLPGGEGFDPASLLFAVDAFPPATFDIEMAGWVPTLELTVYVRALPAPGPVRVLQRAQLISGRRVDESCFVWDTLGRLVAQGTQLAGIRLG